MSGDEKDALIGRLVREDKEVGQELSFIDIQLESVGADLDRLQRLVNKRKHFPYQFESMLPEVPADLSKYINGDNLRDLLNEQKELIEKARKINVSLIELGIKEKPKEKPWS